eukprot:Gb_28819 [translate_table: standard]
MNIVKGVAGLLRRTSLGQAGENPVGSQAEGFLAPPWPEIKFGRDGEEEVLNSLWEKYEDVLEKEEKKKALDAFLLHFQQVYEDWRPAEWQNQLSSQTNAALSIPDLTDAAPNPARMEGGLRFLDALRILTRSIHNQRVFSYYGGLQSLMALMKVAVLQLKALTGAVAMDESQPYSVSVQMSFLQCLLAQIVSVVSNFIGANSCHDEKDIISCYDLGQAVLKNEAGLAGADMFSGSGSSGFSSRKNSSLKQGATIPLMETGGLNWFVELLQVLRRLRLKNQVTEMSLEQLTLRTLKAALTANPRAQNHFKSIGGLEVLIDALGITSKNTIGNLVTMSRGNDPSFIKRTLEDFRLQILSLEVLREAVFGNLNSLQFLFENGGINRLADAIRWSAFRLLEIELPHSDISGAFEPDKLITVSQADGGFPLERGFIDSLPVESCTVENTLDRHNLQGWNLHLVHLCRILCSFLVPAGDIQTLSSELFDGQGAIGVSASYWELAVKWILKVLLSVFPLKKACCDQDEMLSGERILSSTLQHFLLCVFQKILSVTPTVLPTFREEGVWDLMFSEYFFYFKVGVEGNSSPILLDPEAVEKASSAHILMSEQSTCPSPYKNENSNLLENEIFQMEVISFVEFAATINGRSDNWPECSALINALERCACLPEIATMLVKSLHRILQLSADPTVASFNHMDAITRFSEVIWRQQGYSKSAMSFSASLNKPMETVTLQDGKEIDKVFNDENWSRCMEAVFALFAEYFSISEDAKYLALHSSTTADNLFKLLWDEHSRKFALKHILELMKLPPLTEKDQEAKLGLCFKYLETFPRAKESDWQAGTNISANLLAGVRDILQTDLSYYQALFREGECFLHIVTLLNGNFIDGVGEQLSLDVVRTLIDLLTGNEASKCNETLQCYGLEMFHHLLEESTANRASCVRAGLLSLLLDWFGTEESDLLILKLGQLIQMIGGHSITGKDMRKVFALLRSTKDGARPRHSTLLLNTVQGMLKEEGPTVFFELNGRDSGIVITTPMHWPCSRGFSFSCWARVESFPGNDGVMGLFSFLTESGKGCTALINEERLIVETMSQKRQAVSLRTKLASKRWYFLCITHSSGRAFSGGNTLRYYVDAALVGGEKLRYSKVTEPLTRCTIGTSAPYVSVSEDESQLIASSLSSPFCGQLGPVYMFDEALSSDQILGIFSLGPTYMYSFLDSEVGHVQENISTYGILDAKEGLAPKMVFGFNAQASVSRNLFDVSPLVDQTKDQNSYEATIMAGTQLCYRRILEDILDCVGGVSVFFPLLTQLDQPIKQTSVSAHKELAYVEFDPSNHVAAKVIELIASVLDGNLSNQQFMCHMSGFAILGFLLQSVSPQQLTSQVVSALGHLLTVVGKSGSAISEMLVKDALLRIYFNPHVWIYAHFQVQRELYMFLLNYFDANSRILRSLCGLPRILDIIRQFYWDKPKNRRAFGSKPLLHPVTKEAIGERPNPEEIGKIRLLLLSLAEMVLRQHVSTSDVKALAAFLEKSEDMACVEDVLHMMLRLLSHKPFLTTFLEHVHGLGGFQIFINLVKRQPEVIRLQGLQVLGRLMVGIPAEKKGIRLFTLGSGSTKSSIENQRREKSKLEPIFGAIGDRLLSFTFTDSLRATLFDILLGGASPKQVLQKDHHPQERGDGKTSVTGPFSHFVLPQILGVIFKFMLICEEFASREQIMRDLLKLLEANQSNNDSLTSEPGWQAWLLSVLSDAQIRKYHMLDPHEDEVYKSNEEMLVRTIFCVVHCHCICSVKGGWRHVEQTVNFFLLHLEQAQLSRKHLIHELLEDLVQGLLDIASKQNMLTVQPCRDNTLYLLTLIDEILIKDTLDYLPFPGTLSSEDLMDDLLSSEGYEEFGSVESSEVTQGLAEDPSRISDGRAVKKSSSGNQLRGWQHSSSQDEVEIKDHCWDLYEKVWILISLMNGKGPSNRTSTSSASTAPSLGQRARGLVESLNVPAVEMAAAVVSGGLGAVVSINSSKLFDKAIRLRGEKCPRIVFRLVLLYLCKADLEGASRCVQQFVSLLPCLLSADNEQSKNRLQLFIWSLLDARAQVGSLDDGARFHVISQLIRETVRHSKSMLAMSIASKDNSEDPSCNLNEAGSVHSLLQRDKVLAAVRDETKYIKSTLAERLKQVQELRLELEEMSYLECQQKKGLEDEIQSNLTVICSSDGNRRIASRLAYDEDQQIIADNWCHIFRGLTDERGPWSAAPFPNNSLTRWKLDRTEDPWRRRLKLKRNYHFDEQLCHPPSTSILDDSKAVQRVDDLHSGIGSHVLGEVKSFLLKGLRGISQEEIPDVPDNEEDEPLSAGFGSGEISASLDQTVEQIDDCKERCQDDFQQNREEQISTFMETGEDEVLLTVSCVLVTPKRKMAGHLDVMRTSLHFYGEFLVEGTGGSSVFNSLGGLNYPDQTDLEHMERIPKSKSFKGILRTDGDGEKGNPMERLDPVQHQALSGKQPKDIKRHRRWDICKVKAVHGTRYLLQYSATEIFFNNSISPIFLNFASQKHAKEVGTKIASLRNEALFPKLSTKDRDEIIHFVDKRLAIEMAERARDFWRRREISNFEYLMILNTLAGRSYNDLTQYPVFPWVLADYTSENLDFNKAATFRDLSKPVGALDPKRFEVFEERYRNFCDPDIPSFYYGSHYSSMGTILFYLLRLEPFTTLHRNLQGGKFDHADRLFHSIEGTYANCLSNTSDVKELIPEFFYMPEFLVNSNQYHLGLKQDGEPLGDVLLPPWAKNSPEEFIFKNREALESEYVSSNIHQWIDLIFGYKQRGKPAVEAANVFYHLTYEGAVDLEAMEDSLQRAAVEDQIANFGQTPIQLFRKKHPKRGPPVPIARPLYYAPGSITLTSVVSAGFQPPSAIIFVSVMDSSAVLVSRGLTMSVKMWLTSQLQAGGNFTFSSSQEPFFGIGSDLTIPRKVGGPLAENLELGTQCFATLQLRSSNFLLTCGNWENSFRVISLNDGRMVQSIRHHKDVVSCISVATDGSTVVTGSHDTTVMVWEVASSGRGGHKRGRDGQSVPDRHRRDYILSDKPCHILCGHDDVVTCVAVRVELDLVVSGSKDSTCIFHTLREGRYVRSLHHPNGSAISKMVVSQHGLLVMYSNDDLNLLLYSINGKHLATSESNGRVNCMDLSSCGEFLVCAGDQGQLIMRSVHSLEIVRRYDAIGKVILSLTVTPEDCFLVGTQDGSLLVYSIETPQQRKSGLIQNIKSRAFAAG